MDSRDNEDTFKLVKNTLTNVLSDDQLLDPSYATLGNKDNTYTDKAQIMNWLPTPTQTQTSKSMDQILLD